MHSRISPCKRGIFGCKNIYLIILIILNARVFKSLVQSAFENILTANALISFF
nr:MAG TPA: hypothetical protein [Caudoviricetes sp.]